jgi:hypothetical protein
VDEQHQFDALMKLSQFRFERWRERRSLEWKLSLALWTLLVGVPSFFKTQGVHFSACPTALMLVAVWCGHAFWVRTNWISNQMDIKTAFHFAERAEGMLPPSNVIPEKRLRPEQFKQDQGGRNYLHFLKEGACQAQVLVTAMLSIALLLVLNR